jgi:hypothetical protein
MKNSRATTKLANQISKLKSLLPQFGFDEDQCGHFQKAGKSKPHPTTGEVKPLKLRIKVQDISVRVEVKVDGNGEWCKMSSAFFKDIKYADDGSSVKIGRYTFKKSA